MSKPEKQTSKLVDAAEVTAVSSEMINVEEKAVVQEKAAKKAAPKKTTPLKKETAKKDSTKKETTKKESSAKKATKKTTDKVEKSDKVLIPQVIFQFLGNELDANAIANEAKKAWIAEGNSEASIETLAVYIKPEEAAAYYVVNGEPAGKIQL